MASRVTLKSVNDELARLGYTARLEKGGGYFYFQFGEAADWIDRTVNIATVSGRTLNQWVEEFRRLKDLNEQIMGKPTPKKAPRKRSPPAAG